MSTTAAGGCSGVGLDGANDPLGQIGDLFEDVDDVGLDGVQEVYGEF
jgi:hypothetical protein